MSTPLLDRIADLHKQATTERSHYYVGSVLDEATKTITALVQALERIRLSLDGRFGPVRVKGAYDEARAALALAKGEPYTSSGID